MIEQNVTRIFAELPEGVELVAAAKTRTPEEILRAADAGVKIIGENYVQEAQRAFELVGHKVKWHFIGHLQRNKVKTAVKVFDMIETLDSLDLAKEIMDIRSEIPIILCTGFSEMISEVKIKAIGIREFVMKPIIREEITGIVRRVLYEDKKKKGHEL